MPITQTHSDEYSSWVGLIYVFNLIVGTGALTLPAVFAGAGWVLSLILIVLVALTGFITVTFVIECMACANALVHWRRVQSHKIDESEVPLNTDSDEDNKSEQTAIISRRRYRYFNLNQRIELGTIAGLYFSKKGRFFFYVSLCIYLYGDLAIYAAAVSKTMAKLACNSSDNNTDNFELPCTENVNFKKIDVYRAFVVLFAAFVCPFSYFNVQKTKYLQMLTTSMRWCAFVIMITLATVRIYKNDHEGNPDYVNINGVPALLGASIYSFMCHHSLPGLVAPFAEKRFVVQQLGLDYILICLFYLLLSLTGSFAFKNLCDLYTLNFVPTNSNVVMNIVQYFLELFPIFTLSTSFPIIAITLQNNLKSQFLDVNVIERYNFILRYLTFPTLAVVPPILVALLTHNLSSLVEFTGSYAGVVIQYIIPACLVYSARKHCIREIGGRMNNRYASPFRHNFWIVFVICWSFICIIFVTVNLLSVK